MLGAEVTGEVGPFSHPTILYRPTLASRGIHFHSFSELGDCSACSQSAAILFSEYYEY